MLANGDTVDLRRVARDLAHAVAAVCGDAVAEALLAVTYGNDALRVAVPGQVVDAAGDDGVFALCCTLAGAVPYPDHARHISAGDIEARGREAGDGCLCCVLGVLLADGGIVNGAQKDGFARLQTLN